MAVSKDEVLGWLHVLKQRDSTYKNVKGKCFTELLHDLFFKVSAKTASIQNSWPQILTLTLPSVSFKYRFLVGYPDLNLFQLKH